MAGLGVCGAGFPACAGAVSGPLTAFPDPQKTADQDNEPLTKQENHAEIRHGPWQNICRALAVLRAESPDSHPRAASCDSNRPRDGRMPNPAELCENCSGVTERRQ